MTGLPSEHLIRSRDWTRLPLLALVLLAIAASGCMRGSTSSRPPFHPNPNMDSQPKYRPQAASEFFYDGATMRRPIDGTVARGQLLDDPVFFEGRDADGELAAVNPLTIDEAVLARGAERYQIYCTPCHSERGDGRGMLFDRAQIESADLHQERLREVPDGHLFDVITNGLGLMSGYRYPIPARDRWAIVAYVRELQNASGQS